jgi:hypothetical protein
MQREYVVQAVYETSGGDRVAIFRSNDRWFIAWAYSDPFTSVPQLIGFGTEDEAVDVFVSSRHNSEQHRPLAFDSRVDWVRGSL